MYAASIDLRIIRREDPKAAVRRHLVPSQDETLVHGRSMRQKRTVALTAAVIRVW